jgi:hypothetical protein
LVADVSKCFADICGLVTVTYNHYRSPKIDEEARKRSTSQQILDSLLFKEIEWREEQIRETFGETFNWIFEDDSTSFKQWLATGGDTFWIGGKAGSGKSILMKFLANHSMTDEILRKWAGTHKLIIVKHFFWNSGTKMQQSQLGLMQSLLHQILQQCPELIALASPQRWEAVFSNANVKAWTRKELSLAVQNIVARGSLDAYFCIFIDGLDEYIDQEAGDHYQLVQDLDSLVKSGMVKLCVSSRPWTVFLDRYSTNKRPKIIVEDHTSRDIRLYTSGMLAQDARFHRLAAVESNAYSLVYEILERADGVFLWVFLVVRTLLRGLTEHDDKAELERRLGEMPSDLNAYFRKMFDNIDSVYRPEAMRVFQMIAVVGQHAQCPLIFIYFISREVLDSGYGLGAKVCTMTETEIAKAHDKARSYLNKWGRDLLEISMPAPRYGHWIENVGVSHRTVRDFLLTQEMRKEFLEYPICQVSPLKGLCMAYLALFKIRFTASMSGDSIDGNFLRVIELAKKCEDMESMTPFDILDDLDVTTRTATEQKNNSTEISRHDSTNRVLRLAARNGLTLYVGMCFDRDPSCKSDIWSAVLHIFEHTRPGRLAMDQVQVISDMTCMLLAKGFDLNEVSDEIIKGDSLHNKTAWQQLLRNFKSYTWPEVAELFLLNGADPDVKMMDRDGCLHDVRQCLLAGEWCQIKRDIPDREREIDRWLANARARKAAKSLEALEYARKEGGLKRSRRQSHGRPHPSSSASSAQSSRPSTQIRSFTLPYHSSTPSGFRWRPEGPWWRLDWSPRNRKEHLAP